MYHEEKVINEVLHWRGTPKGEWVSYTPEQLTQKLRKAKKYLVAITRVEACLRALTE